MGTEWPIADSRRAVEADPWRSIWAAPEVELSPALKFLRSHQRAELSPIDAQRLGIGHGDRITVGTDGSRVHAIATLRAAVPEGSVFLESGISSDSATELDGGGLVEIERA